MRDTGMGAMGAMRTVVASRLIVLFLSRCLWKIYG